MRTVGGVRVLQGWKRLLRSLAAALVAAVPAAGYAHGQSVPVAAASPKDGDPLENTNLIADPARNFLVIMKNGVIYKNIDR